jgi:hypothetical protein
LLYRGTGEQNTKQSTLVHLFSKKKSQLSGYADTVAPIDLKSSTRTKRLAGRDYKKTRAQKFLTPWSELQ